MREGNSVTVASLRRGNSLSCPPLKVSVITSCYNSSITIVVLIIFLLHITHTMLHAHTQARTAGNVQSSKCLLALIDCLRMEIISWMITWNWT